MVMTDSPEATGPVRVVPDAAPSTSRDALHADFPVTGPMPAISLAGGHLWVHDHDDVTILAVDGGLDAELTDEIGDAFLTTLLSSTCLIIDLDDATLLNPSGVNALLDLAATHGKQSICLVAGRLSSRLVLERWGVTSRVALFGSTADALQARTFSDCGYGNGWAATF